MCMSESIGCLWDGLSCFFLLAWERERDFWVQQSKLMQFWEGRDGRRTHHSFYKHIFEPLQTQPTGARGNSSSRSPFFRTVCRAAGWSRALSHTHTTHTHTHSQMFIDMYLSTSEESDLVSPNNLTFFVILYDVRHPFSALLNNAWLLSGSFQARILWVGKTLFLKVS